MADDVKARLDEMRRKATEALHEARSIVGQMNVVETIFDLPTTKLADLETAALGTPTTITPWESSPPDQRQHGVSNSAKRRTGAIRPDEYFGAEPLEAAKAFMKSVGHAVAFDEITDAIQKGGAAIMGADWRDRLEISLKRSPYQVITVADKTYGLAEFYTEEQLKRFRTTRRGDSDSEAKKKKAKAAKAKKKAVVVAKKPEASVTAKTSKPKAHHAQDAAILKGDGDDSAPIH